MKDKGKGGRRKSWVGDLDCGAVPRKPGETGEKSSGIVRGTPHVPRAGLPGSPAPLSHQQAAAREANTVVDSRKHSWGRQSRTVPAVRDPGEVSRRLQSTPCGQVQRAVPPCFPWASLPKGDSGEKEGSRRANYPVMEFISRSPSPTLHFEFPSLSTTSACLVM